MRLLPVAALLAALSAPLGAQQDSANTVTVELSNFHFTPETITLRHGETWHLRLVNHARGGHNFAAPEFFGASAVAAEDSGKVAGGKIALAGEQVVDVAVTPNVPGTYSVRCTHFMHTAFGMKGQIVVQ